MMKRACVPALMAMALVAASGCAPQQKSVSDEQMAQANFQADFTALKSRSQETRMRLEELENRLGGRGDGQSLQDLNQRLSRLEETVARMAATLGVDVGARAPSAAPVAGPNAGPAPGSASGPASGPAYGTYTQSSDAYAPSGGYQTRDAAPSRGYQTRDTAPPMFGGEDDEAMVYSRTTELDIPRAGAPSSNDPAQAMYDMAMSSLNQRDYDRANTLFAELLKSYPNSAQAPGALFWQAEANFQQGDFARAALICQDLIQKHPKSQLVPAAMLKQALCFKRLGKNQAAKILLQDVSKLYPGTAEARSAQAQLKELR